MGLEKLSAGTNPPEEINVVIEIGSMSVPIKYEYEKEANMIHVDRFLETTMFYPCEYGFIPQTLSEDGDPVDVLVVAPFSLMPGVFITCRPIGMLKMTDEAGKDTKILSVPISKVSKKYDHVQKPADLEEIRQIEHFFRHYKDLEQGKWSKIDGWEDANAAKEAILEGIQRYRQKYD